MHEVQFAQPYCVAPSRRDEGIPPYADLAGFAVGAANGRPLGCSAHPQISGG